MGLFSSKKILHAETLTAKLFPEEADPLAKATITAIQSGGDIHNFQMAAYIGGFALYARRYLDYGKKHYLLGLPEGFMGTMGIDIPAAESALRTLLGRQVTVLGGSTGEPVLAYFAYQALREKFDWDYETNKTRPFATTLGTYPLNLVGYAVIKGEIKATLKLDMSLMSATHAGAGTAITPPEVTVTLGPAPDPTHMYTHVQYHWKSEPAAKTRFWVYDTSTNRFPDLHPEEEEGTPLMSPFYPIVPLRIDKKFLGSGGYEKGRTGLSDSATALLKKIRLKPSDLISAIEGPDEKKDANGKVTNKDELNKDLGDMDDAYFMFALDIYTKVEASLEYLNNFFHGLALGSPTSKTMFERYIQDLNKQASEPGGGRGGVDMDGVIAPPGHPLTSMPTMSGITPIVPQNSVVIKEGNDFIMRFTYNYIEYTAVKSGKLTKKFEREVIIRPEIKIGADEGFNEDGFQTRATQEIEASSIIFKKRLTDTTYTQVEIHGLKHEVLVSKEGKRKKVTRVLTQVDYDRSEKNDRDHKGDSGLFIPLAYDIIESIHDRLDREIVLYDGMMLVIMAGKIETLKWYQKGIFKILITIAVFILTVYLVMNFGPGGMTLAQAVFQTLSQMAMAWTLSIVVGLVMEKIGGKLGMIIALIITVAAMYFSGHLDLSKFKFPTAQDFMDSTKIFIEKTGEIMNTVGTIGNSYNQFQAAALKNEFENMLLESEEKMEELEEARNGLPKNDNPYDPLYVREMIETFHLNENPRDFYDRVLTNNPGVLTLDVIKDWHGNMLKLPEKIVEGDYRYI